MALYSVYAVVQKYHKIYFIYNYSHFKYSFRNQPVIWKTWRKFAQRKQTVEQQRTVHVNERNQNKSKTKSCHIQIY